MQQSHLSLNDVIDAVERCCASSREDLLEITALHEQGTDRKMVAVVCKTQGGDLNPSNVPEGYEAALWIATMTLAECAGAQAGPGTVIRISWPHGERGSVTVSTPPDDDTVVEVMRDAGQEPSQAPRVLH